MTLLSSIKEKLFKFLFKRLIKEIQDNQQNNFFVIKRNMEEIKVLHAKQIKFNSSNILSDIHDAEFKVFSQWGDDGIIQYLISIVQPQSRTFIEFGVENYTESNTRFLLINNNWKGLIMDGGKENIQYIQSDDLYWRFNLTALQAFITTDNINGIIKDSGFGGPLGLLHIDIDGNDYWVWKSIDVVFPEIVIVEYNSIYGYKRPITIPYKSDFTRSDAHFSNLYYGTSLLALCNLAKEKGYAFIGCNSNGNNAYFVKKEKLNGLREVTAEEGYVEASFRESRNKNKKLTFLSLEEKLNTIKGLPVFNVETNQLETF